MKKLMVKGLWPWKYFSYTDEELDRLTHNRLYYKAPKGYRSVRLKFVKADRVSFKKPFVIDEYGAYYSSIGWAKTCCYAKTVSSLSVMKSCLNKQDTGN